eukprot:3938873-Rhodomonas_salina.1
MQPKQEKRKSSACSVEVHSQVTRRPTQRLGAVAMLACHGHGHGDGFGNFSLYTILDTPVDPGIGSEMLLPVYAYQGIQFLRRVTVPGPGTPGYPGTRDPGTGYHCYQSISLFSESTPTGMSTAAHSSVKIEDGARKAGTR